MRTRSAKPTQSTSAQPIATTPTSPPSRLPPELIAHVQALAEEGSTPGEIKRIRARFELVNKEWYNTVDYFTHLVITQPSDVAKLTTKLRSSKLRALLTTKTKTISIEMRGFKRKADFGKLLGLMKWVKQAESVSIKEVSGELLLGFGVGNSSEVIGAMASFANLRHFTFRQHRRSVPISPDKITRVEVVAQVGDLFPRRTLALGSIAGWRAVQDHLTGLPPSVRVLRLFVSDLHPSPAFGPALNQLAAIAPRLTEFAFIDQTDYHPQDHVGFLDNVVANLTGVECLKIDVRAVRRAEMAAKLAPLAGLREVTFVKAKGMYAIRLSATQVTKVIEGAASLKTLRLCSDSCERWSTNRRDKVKRAAGKKGIKLVWTR